MRHYNPSITERLFRIFRPKAGDQFSDEVSPNVVAVVPITPVVRIVNAGGGGITGLITGYTTPANKDFYLTGLSFSIAKDAACDATSGNISVTGVIDGQVVAIATISGITLTALQDTITMQFPFPLKLDRNTAITQTYNFTAGVCRRVINVHGYTEEVITT